MICDCAGSLAVPPLSTHQNLKSHKNMLRNRTLFPPKKKRYKISHLEIFHPRSVEILGQVKFWFWG